jgi:hypothetical protein
MPDGEATADLHPVSPGLSARRPSLLEPSYPAGDFCLPHGRPTAFNSGLRRGFHVPRVRDAAGVGALYAPGRRCPPGRRETSARRLPHLSGPPCTLLPHPTGRVLSHETSSRVHCRSPVRPSPCLSPPGGTGALGLLPGASHPAVTSDARPGGDGSSDTDPGLPCHRRHRRPPLQRAVHSPHATSCRTPTR